MRDILHFIRQFAGCCDNSTASNSSHELKMLRYSGIPKDTSGDSLATDKEISISPCNPLDIDSTDLCTTVTNGCLKPPTNGTRKISTHSVSGGPGPPYSYYSYSNVPVHIKTQSLPNQFSKNYSCAVYDPMQISPEDFANQLTLLDLPIFLAIQPDELTSCGWNKKNKMTIAPNVVAFTRRFNHVSFWAVQEILSRSTPKQRADVLGHFIKIAKRLYDLNNLHSLFAIISALHSASVYRLSKTWSCLTKKEKQSFDKLSDVFSDSENWSNLRSHIESLKLPCIPYLGLYLTDLVYIDMAHPHSGGLESQQRSLKMNNILRIISNYQLSDYSHVSCVPHVKDYLNSIRYIEELQKFVEDDQYKLSLKLEPPSPIPSSSSCSSKESVIADGTAIASLNLSPAKISSGSLRLTTASTGNKFTPGHRKCRSLGTKFRSASLPRNFHKQGCPVLGRNSVVATLGIFSKTHHIVFDPKDLPKTLHLLDDSELEDANTSTSHSELPSPITDIPLQASRNTSEDSTLLTKQNEDSLSLQEPFCPMQGCIRRKTLLKHGKKPAVASWQRYWIQIWSSSLAYFSPKSFKGNQRSDFKSEPCKMVSLIGCQIFLSDNTLHPDLFQIVDQQKGNVYKFRSGSQGAAERWCKYLKMAASNEQTPLPTNLMSFE
ncbi:ras-specific guanine nucleotide-releasing factor RalGPS2-like isoform X2 [Onthophagus taurus]|uniref:ras-specific guanine nucleotide-releasing factor RalGPS2-like isoform X2 n=1 Tax=Onthophagus taurus TaxID=166361 RepID=UPI0039BDED46